MYIIQCIKEPRPIKPIDELVFTLELSPLKSKLQTYVNWFYFQPAIVGLLDGIPPLQ